MEVRRMRTLDLGRPIAQRSITLSGQDEVIVTIGTPHIPAGYPDEYWCVYRIEGLSKPRTSYAIGVDSMQALYLALMNIATDLYMSAEGREGQLSWLGGADLGFPVADSIADVVPRRK